jgi:hypothetical protein
MPDLNSTIDILAVVDAESIIAQYADKPLSKDPTRPVYLATNTNLVYMFVKKDEAVDYQGQSSLIVAVRPGDSINWRAESLTKNTDYCVLLSACQVNQSGQQSIQPPRLVTTQVYIPLPVIEGGKVTHATRQDFLDSYFYSTANSANHSVLYSLTFVITDRSGEPFGYFTWDPALSIS